MEATTHTSGGPLIIERVNAKIGALERRAEHLQRRIKEHVNDSGRNFDITELQAIEAGIAALRFHRSMLSAEVNPVLALDELLVAIDEWLEGDEADSVVEERLQAAREHAKKVLADIKD